MNAKCPFCSCEFQDDPSEGRLNCPECMDSFKIVVVEDEEGDDSMDGDAGSALASAGFGTDEDYEHNLYDE